MGGFVADNVSRYVLAPKFMEIFQRFRFEAARRLPALPSEHPCSRLHGHSFQVELQISGPLDPALGWVLDFAEIQAAWAPLRAVLDHRCLNELEGLENPTSEHLAIWIWEHLKPVLPQLSAVQIMETPDSGCVYRGVGGCR
jgi:6-pyruvoyltetrahydropterin/6-carboxytetrahydropterin synthase